ncbi:TetR/AcrR family transcriptional regulator, partial [Streptomyces sp. EKR5.2]
PHPYALISSFFFRVANRHTFAALFGHDLMATGRREHYRRMLGDMVVAYLTADRARA